MSLTVTGLKEDTALGNTMIKRCYKKRRLYFSMCYDKYKKLYYCHRFSSILLYMSTCFMEHKKILEQRFILLLLFCTFYPLLYLLNIFCLFSYYSIDHSLLQSPCLIWLKFSPYIFLMFECMWLQTFHTVKLYWTSSCLKHALKDGHDMMQKQLPTLF